MKKLKLVALLAVLALTIATFVTMLAMPASAAAVADAGTDTNVYTGFADDAAALSAGCIGRFGDAQGTSVEYVKSIAGLLNGGTAADNSASRFGSSDKYLKFNLLVDLTTTTRLRFYNFDGSTGRTTNAVFDGNGHTITATAGGAQHFRGNVTVKNLTLTGTTSHLAQVASSGVVFGSGTTIENTKAGGYVIIISSSQTVTIDGATVTGTMDSTDGIVVPWGNGCTVNVKSGKIINKSTAADKGAAALSYARGPVTNTTFNISGGTIEAVRPINFPSSDQKTNKLTISGGTITCKDSSGTNNSYCITWSGSTTNSVVNITGGTFNGQGTFLAGAGSNNTLNFGGNAVVTTTRDSRGFIQDGGSNNNTYNITGGTMTSAGYGFVNLGTNAKVNITGGTLTALTNNFFHLQANKGQTINISGNAKIICGLSETDHTRNFINPTIAECGVKFTVEGGTIYCGDILETAGNTDLVVDIKGGTFHTENALYAASATASGALNISGGTVNCSNAALWVTGGATALNVYDGATINTKNLLGTRAYAAASGTTAAVAASDGVGKLKVFGGDINCSGNALNLYLGDPTDYAYASAVEIYGGDIYANGEFVYANRGGAGTVDVYGGNISTTGRIASLTTKTYLTINIHGGIFKSLFDDVDDGADINITTGLIYMSADTSFANVYGGRFYILTDLNNINSFASTGAHLVPWAGAMENLKFYGGEFFGGTHVMQKLAHASGKVDTANSTYIAMTTGGYFASPVTRDGASIRVSEGSMGIRFQSSISKAVLDHAKTFGTVKYGTIITPLDFGMKLGAGLLGGADNYVKIEATANGTTTDANGNVTFNAALTNIKEANLGRQFVACAYIEITTTSGEVVTIYAVDKAIRSIDQVAKAALADYKTEAEITENDKATYNRMTTIYCDKATNEMVYGGTPVYTRFNNAQIAAIGKQIVVK